MFTYGNLVTTFTPVGIYALWAFEWVKLGLKDLKKHTNSRISLKDSLQQMLLFWITSILLNNTIPKKV